jgi:nucleotide-binding universal stress UspA family protein
MYKRVLVPLDGSPLAEAVIPFLTEMAGPLDMSVVLLRVLEPVPPLIVEGLRQVLVDVSEARRRDARTYLEGVAAPLQARGIETACEVRAGRPDERIVETARELAADLIAMSTHGRSGLGRLLFGSVAEQVLRHADVPVFMMRHIATKTPAVVGVRAALSVD